jgi:hypothetical protein
LWSLSFLRSVTIEPVKVGPSSVYINRRPELTISPTKLLAALVRAVINMTVNNAPGRSA